MFRLEKQRTFGLNTMQGTNKLSHLEMIGHQLISLTRRQIAKTSYTASSETAVACGADCPLPCGGIVLMFQPITVMPSHTDKSKRMLRNTEHLNTMQGTNNLTQPPGDDLSSTHQLVDKLQRQATQLLQRHQLHA